MHSKEPFNLLSNSSEEMEIPNGILHHIKLAHGIANVVSLLLPLRRLLLSEVCWQRPSKGRKKGIGRLEGRETLKLDMLAISNESTNLLSCHTYFCFSVSTARACSAA